MITEICSCGASITFPTDVTREFLDDWRANHRHDPAPEHVLIRDWRDSLPLHRTEAGYPRCSTCDGGGCPDCTDPE